MDSIIEATANLDADVFVTEDRRFRRRAGERLVNVDVWDFQDFHRYINSI